MTIWILKALLQGAIALVPNSEQVNYWFQRSITHSLRPRGMRSFSKRMEWTTQHLKYWKLYGSGTSLPNTVYELGTGWFPTVPICLYLCGVQRTVTIDIHDLIRRTYFREMFIDFCETDVSLLQEKLPDLNVDRFESIKELSREIYSLSPQEILKEMGITQIIGDATQDYREINSIDLIVSNTTLEHIPYQTIHKIFLRFAQVLQADGVMSHRTDMSDHYAHFDKKITAYNYLRYPTPIWNFFNNSLLYQNRLRWPDYQRLHYATGFEIIYEDLVLNNAPSFNRLKVANEFEKYTTEELLPTGVWQVSKKSSCSK